MIIRCADSSDFEGQQIPVRVVAGLHQLALIGVGAVEVRTVGLRALMNFINLLYGLCIYVWVYIYIYIYIWKMYVHIRDTCGRYSLNTGYKSLNVRQIYINIRDNIIYQAPHYCIVF